MISTHKIRLFLLTVIIIISILLLVQNKNSLPTTGTSDYKDLPLKPTAKRGVVVQQYAILGQNPHSAFDMGSARVFTNVFEGLVRFKPGTALVEPCLATHWQVSSNGLVWTFKLRSNVTFHDGTPFNAQVAALNFNHCLNQTSPNINNNYINFVFAPMSRVEVVDESTIKLHLKYPYAPLLNNLALPMAAVIVSPADIKQDESLDQKNKQPNLPVGTGPYCLAQLNNKQALLQANPHYWGAQPPLPEILFATVPDHLQRTQLLTKKQADLVLDISADQAQTLRQHNYQIFSTTGLDLCYLGFYTDKKPFQNPALRRAIAMAIDPQKIIDTNWPGAMRPAQNILPPTSLGYAGTEQNYNPGQARELLKQAGYGSDFSFTLITYKDPRPYTPAGGQALARALSQALADINIKVNIKTYPWEDFKQALVKREGDAFLYGWTCDNGDPDNFLFPLLAQSQIKQGQNIFGYNNPNLDTLLIDARGTEDQQKRRQLYQRVQTMVNQDQPLIVINHSIHYAAATSNIKGFILSPTNYHRFNDTIKK